MHTQKALLVAPRLFALWIAASLGLTSPSAQAQEAVVNGFVTDAQTGRPLELASVALLQSSLIAAGTVTDASGAFVLPRLAPGRYALRASFIGYAPFADTLDLEGGETRTLEIALEEAATGLDEVVVEQARTGGGRRCRGGGAGGPPRGPSPASRPWTSRVTWRATSPPSPASSRRRDRGGQLFVRGRGALAEPRPPRRHPAVSGVPRPRLLQRLPRRHRPPGGRLRGRVRGAAWRAALVGDRRAEPERAPLPARRGCRGLAVPGVGAPGGADRARAGLRARLGADLARGPAGRPLRRRPAPLPVRRRLREALRGDGADGPPLGERPPQRRPGHDRRGHRRRAARGGPLADVSRRRAVRVAAEGAPHRRHVHGRGLLADVGAGRRRGAAPADVRARPSPAASTSPSSARGVRADFGLAARVVTLSSLLGGPLPEPLPFRSRERPVCDLPRPRVHARRPPRDAERSPAGDGGEDGADVRAAPAGGVGAGAAPAERGGGAVPPRGRRHQRPPRRRQRVHGVDEHPRAALGLPRR